jgi:type IV pilus assembly protein PilW
MRTPAQRGLTLVELLVALAASAIVLVSVLAAVTAQQTAYQGGQRVREAQGASRNALLFIEQKLAMAGFGMDPVLAFDLTGQPGDPDNVVWTAGPCPADAAPCVKDRTDGSDELVFFARNPNYWIPPPVPPPAPGLLSGRVWQVLNFNPGGDQITLAARQGDLFPMGQILQGVCNEGEGQSYFTVSVTAGGPGGQPLPANQALTINLIPDVLANPFTRQNAGDCQPTRVYQIDRYRFHIRPVSIGGNRFDSYLVLDRGLDVTGNGGAPDGVIDAMDEAILASGVEILQVAYHFTSNINVGAGTDTTLPPAGLTAGTAAVSIVGGTAASATTTAETITRTSFAASTMTVDPRYYKNASFYDYRFGPPLATERQTNHQANISAVTVMLVTRSDNPAPDSGGWIIPGPQAPVANMNQTPAWIAGGAPGGRDAYERIRLDTTVQLSNLVARRLLYD